MPRKIPHIELILGIAVSVLCLFLAFRGINLGRFIENFRHFDPVFLFPIGLLLFLYYLAQSFRWKFILLSKKDVSFSRLLYIITFSAMITTVSPARLGDLVRAYALSKKEGIRKSFCLATIVVEKCIDLVFAVSLLALTINFLRLPAYLMLAERTLAAFLITAFIIILMIALFKDKAADHLGSMIGRLLPGLKEKIVSVIHSFMEGVLSINRFSSFLFIILCTVLSWSAFILAFYLAIISFGIQVPLSAAIMLVLILTVGFNLPVSPGYIGTFQYFSVIALSLFNIEKSVALSFSFVLQFVTILFPVCFGLFFAWKDHLFSLVNIDK